MHPFERPTYACESRAHHLEIFTRLREGQECDSSL